VLPDDIQPDSAFAELIRLAQAGVEESVMLAYIENTLRLFELDADDIIYLTDLGVPAEVIKAAMEHDQKLIEEGISPEGGAAESGPSAEDPAVQPEEVTADVFYDSLAPYGVWVHIDGYGRCWRPIVVVYNTSWHPYCDNGRWIYTDCGWYWHSGYSWGWATFHYGRWFRHARYGWCWWPDTVWAPSWVYWRYDRSYCGWAPLPPYTHYRSGFGLVYRGDRVSAGFDFGLSADTYTFVAVQDFADPKPGSRRVDKGEASRIFARTTPYYKINYDRRQGRIHNAGIPRNDIARASRREIRPVSISEVQTRGVRGKPERSERSGSTFYRPQQTPSGNRAQSARRTDVQGSSYRAERQDKSTAGSGVTKDSRREMSYQAPQARQRSTPRAQQKPSPQARQNPSPRVTPQQSERSRAAAPRQSSSYRSSQRPAQNNRSKPAPALNSAHRAPQPVPAPQANSPAPRRMNENNARGRGAGQPNGRAP
jgi:hypothetical protein